MISKIEKIARVSGAMSVITAFLYTMAFLVHFMDKSAWYFLPTVLIAAIGMSVMMIILSYVYDVLNDR